MVKKINNIKDFTLVLPILNESENLNLLLKEIRSYSQIKNLNVLVIDDNSEDRFISKKISSIYDAKYFLRNKERSLSGSIIESINYFKTKYLIVMDSDLQHDPKNIIDMINFVNFNNSDVIVGYRDLNNLNFNFTFKRKFMSNFGIFLSNFILHKKFKDPMTGFFLIKYDILTKISDKLYYGGGKILFNILIYCSNLKVDELLINFRSRKYSFSKINLNWHYFFLRVFISGIIFKIKNFISKILRN